MGSASTRICEVHFLVQGDPWKGQESLELGESGWVFVGSVFFKVVARRLAVVV